MTTVPFTDDWLLQSSERIAGDGAVLSAYGVQRSDWYATRLPATVLGTLVQHGVYEDPFFGLNWQRLPGHGPAHENFSNHPMPEDSPFRVPWWFYKEFSAELDPSRPHLWLGFEGINYRANVWLNGKRLADSRAIAGAYREHELLLDATLASGTNRLALEVFPPAPDDLAITWVDWNPSPPDKNTGLFRPARLHATGPVALKHPQVVARFPESFEVAELELYTTLENASADPQQGVLVCRIDGRAFDVAFEIGARERRAIAITSRERDVLRLVAPRLWWPRRLGAQPLYRLDLEIFVKGRLSDTCTLDFGVRKVSCELTDQGHSLFRVNDKPILIRGGGWASDLFLRSNAERTLAEYEYVKDLDLNAIRFEGMLERRDFLERCDRDGMLVIAGFCCCDHWEKWADWKAEDHEIAAESLRSQLRRIRNHPSLLAWWYGSDNPPPAHVERRYLEILDEERWPNPAHSSAAAKPTELSGPSGLKMAGPYDYVPPNYWLTDTTRGGAFGFATEISPGPAIPPLESLRAMLGEQHLWPPDECWTLHAGGGPFKDLTRFNDALAARYGAPTSLADYLNKAQLSTYESQRAMFEAFARQKYGATGVIQWMLNNAWPSLIWHLWDWYLRPGGGYFGTKKACEPLHVQYSYDDHSVIIVNELPQRASSLTVEARTLNLDSTEIWRSEARLDVGSDSAVRALEVPVSARVGPTFFLHLALRDSAGSLTSTNFYWLSSAPDRVDDENGNWYTTPLVAHADLRGLSTLLPADLGVSCSSRATTAERGRLEIELSNRSAQIAFFLRLRLISQDETGERELLPVLWDDNFMSLLPHESRRLGASFAKRLTREAPLELEISGWNLDPLRVRPSRSNFK